MQEFEGIVNGKYKIYKDPNYKEGDPIIVGYKGLSKWSNEFNEEIKAKLDMLVYDSLNEGERESYDRYRKWIALWEKGIDPLKDAGFFYCPYIPLKD